MQLVPDAEERVDGMPALNVLVVVEWQIIARDQWCFIGTQPTQQLGCSSMAMEQTRSPRD